jgi:hypothetical protein
MHGCLCFCLFDFIVMCHCVVLFDQNEGRMKGLAFVLDPDGCVMML